MIRWSRPAISSPSPRHTPMHLLRSAAAAVLGSLLLLSPAHAQPVREHPQVRQALHLLETWLDAQRAYERIPGVSGAVVHDQEVLWTGGSGYADLASRAPATARTVYSICSISKLFTSVALMQLRDAGGLRLDDPVAEHLAYFGSLRRTEADAPEITVRGLLTHSSGLPREANSPYWSGPDFRFPSQEEIIAGLAEQEPLYRASTYFQYSNLGLTLAGELVEARSGQPYSDYVRQQVLGPLGLGSTTTDMPAELRGKQLATGYSAVTREGSREVVPFYQARGIVPAAGYASTAEDLARFAAWQFRLLGAGGTEVLNANTLREMHRVHWVDPDFGTYWGLGFSVWRDAEKTFVGHGGSCPGYRTMLALQPESRVATVFMANAMAVSSGAFAQRMHDIVAPAVAAAKDTTRRVPPPDTTLLRYTGSYSNAPWSGETAVLEWEDGLAMLSLPTMDPVKALVKLRRVEGEHTFRRVRKDGALGEAIRFEVGPDGRATRYWQHGNPSPRIAGGG
jgi:CubicO group peptidase (beta-lactamase class C family)